MSQTNRDSVEGNRGLGPSISSDSPERQVDGVGEFITKDSKTGTEEHIGSDISDDSLNDDALAENGGTEAVEISCPICEETMVSLYQLNQHIDDVHNEDGDEEENGNGTKNMGAASSNGGQDGLIKKLSVKKFTREKSPKKNKLGKTTRKRKVQLDLLDSNKGFSISAGTDSEEGDEKKPSETTNINENITNKVSRKHWKQPSSGARCSQQGCNKPLNIKNGIVNCRRCGLLYCNDHTKNKVKLHNSDRGSDVPEFDASRDGQWCRCCSNCYWKKPDLVKGTQVNLNDITSRLNKIRARKVEEKELHRIKLKRRFLKLVEAHLENHLLEDQSSILNRFKALSNLSKTPVTEKEKEIIGFANWQDETLIKNCNICLSEFDLLLWKHHCRLCGKVVCDDFYRERKGCSIIVPIGSLLEKLPNLNYNSLVRLNWDTIVENKGKDFALRCCVNCKDDLLHDWMPQNLQEEDSIVFSILDQFLGLKSQITILMPKYEQVIELSNKLEANRLRSRIMRYTKDIERIVMAFRNEFYDRTETSIGVKERYVDLTTVINNIQLSMATFLQDTLLSLKDLNLRLKEKEDLEVAANKQQMVSKPRLTLKQIREMREVLMVMNEQKFLVENQIDTVTKQRKFDELAPLVENRDELNFTISELEKQLGEYGF